MEKWQLDDVMHEDKSYEKVRKNKLVLIEEVVDKNEGDIIDECVPDLVLKNGVVHKDRAKWRW